MKDKLFSTREASQLLNVPYYRITYAETINKAKRPAMVFGRKAYRWQDLLELADYFGVELNTTAQNEPEKGKS